MAADLRGAAHADRQTPPVGEPLAPSGRRPAQLRGRALAEQILAVVADLEQRSAGYHRGPAYRRLALTLAELCRWNTAMVGDLLGVSRQAAWELLQRARRDARLTTTGGDQRR
jgi:hypothetical protein